nr:hypothetical protein [Acetivibrio ethanolgignens]
MIAVVSGVYLSVMYINPHNGVTSLSEMILQLSGSRGSFVLGFSYSELASFAMRLFPEFIFELYAGIMLYRHFCTASIYIFSRYPHRVRWYIGEVSYLGGAVCIFNMLLLAVTILTTASRYGLQIDSAGIVLMAYHLLIHSLWMYGMTLSVNLLAIYLGSSTAYALVISVQLVCIVLLNLMDLIVKYYDGKLSYGNVLKWNPIAHLVLGWHSSNMVSANQVLTSSDMQVDLKCSLIMFLLFGIIITSTGAFIIKEYDLLVSDLETEVA